MDHISSRTFQMVLPGTSKSHKKGGSWCMCFLLALLLQGLITTVVQGLAAPFEKFSHASELCELYTPKGGEHKHVHDERQLAAAILQSNVSCIFVNVAKLTLTSDYWAPEGDFFREHSQDACTRIAVPVCAWQLIQRTLVVVPASGISQAQVVHPADMQWYNTRFSVVHPGHVLIAGFTMRNAYDFTDTSEMAYKLNNISLSDSFSSIYRALSRTLYTTALRTPFFISWYCSKECGSIEHHNMTERGICSWPLQSAGHGKGFPIDNIHIALPSSPVPGSNINMTLDDLANNTKPHWSATSTILECCEARCKNPSTCVDEECKAMIRLEGQEPVSQYTHNDQTYELFSSTFRNWDNAQSFCSGLLHAGKLATFPSSYVFNIVINKLLPPVHKKLTSWQSMQMESVWVDGSYNLANLSTNNAYFEWDPENTQKRACVALNVARATMFPTECTHFKPFLCVSSLYEDSDISQGDLLKPRTSQEGTDGTDATQELMYIAFATISALFVVLVGFAGYKMRQGFAFRKRFAVYQDPRAAAAHSASRRALINTNSNDFSDISYPNSPSVGTSQSITRELAIRIPDSPLSTINSVPESQATTPDAQELTSSYNRSVRTLVGVLSQQLQYLHESSEGKDWPDPCEISFAVSDPSPKTSGGNVAADEEDEDPNSETWPGAAGSKALIELSPLDLNPPKDLPQTTKMGSVLEEATGTRADKRKELVDFLEQMSSKEVSPVNDIEIMNSRSREEPAAIIPKITEGSKISAELQKLASWKTALMSTKTEASPDGRIKVTFAPSVGSSGEGADDHDNEMMFRGFKVLALIGTGSHSECYLVQKPSSSMKYVMKIPVEGDIAGLVREAYFMQTLKHPNLVTLNDMFLEDGCITLVSEYCDKGDLQSLIDLKLPFTEDFVIHVLFQLAMGVAYIHHQHVAHRDIKPANVFITSKGIIKLGDFGVSRLMVDTSSTFTGTPVFMAPEILEGHPYNKTSDIWSLGSVMYTLCMLKVPFMANHVSRLREMKMNEPHEPIPKGGEHRDELVDLIDRMLSIDPDARPTAREICEIPWLASSCFEGSATFLRDVKSISLPPKEKSRNESSSSHVRKPTGQTKPSRLKRHQSCNR